MRCITLLARGRGGWKAVADDNINVTNHHEALRAAAGGDATADERLRRSRATRSVMFAARVTNAKYRLVVPDRGVDEVRVWTALAT